MRARFCDLAAERAETLTAEQRKILLRAAAAATPRDPAPGRCRRVEAGGHVLYCASRSKRSVLVFLVTLPGFEEHDLALAEQWLAVEGDWTDLDRSLAWRRAWFQTQPSDRRAEMLARALGPGDAADALGRADFAAAFAALGVSPDSWTTIRRGGLRHASLRLPRAPGDLELSSGPAASEAEALALMLYQYAYARLHPALRRDPDAPRGPRPHVAVVGSRGFERLDLVRDFVAGLNSRTAVVTGGARGVDRTAEQAARSRGLLAVVFPADWRWFGRRAGPLRNVKIVRAADRLAAFWDGKSRGTLGSVALARDKGIPVEIFGPKGKPVPLAQAMDVARAMGALALVKAARGG